MALILATVESKCFFSLVLFSYQGWKLFSATKKSLLSHADLFRRERHGPGWGHETEMGPGGTHGFNGVESFRCSRILNSGNRWVLLRQCFSPRKHHPCLVVWRSLTFAIVCCGVGMGFAVLINAVISGAFFVLFASILLWIVLRAVLEFTWSPILLLSHFCCNFIGMKKTIQLEISSLCLIFFCYYFLPLLQIESNFAKRCRRFINFFPDYVMRVSRVVTCALSHCRMMFLLHSRYRQGTSLGRLEWCGWWNDETANFGPLWWFWHFWILLGVLHAFCLGLVLTSELTFGLDMPTTRLSIVTLFFSTTLSIRNFYTLCLTFGKRLGSILRLKWRIFSTQCHWDQSWCTRYKTQRTLSVLSDSHSFICSKWHGPRRCSGTETGPWGIYCNDAVESRR